MVDFTDIPILTADQWAECKLHSFYSRRSDLYFNYQGSPYDISTGKYDDYEESGYSLSRLKHELEGYSGVKSELKISSLFGKIPYGVMHCSYDDDSFCNFVILRRGTDSFILHTMANY
jgi:hypothetical protein